MAAPAYHLRTNKAVDRFLFMEAIRRLIGINESGDYKYYSFGGPYLDDFRLIHELFPEIDMISIERDNEVYKRQKFHLPSGRISLKQCDMHSFLSNYDSEDEKSIFWLDYTGLDYNQFEEFMLVLSKVASNSIVKITLQCTPGFYQNKPTDAKDEHGNFKVDKQESFRKKFGNVLPSSSVGIPRNPIDFAQLLQDMIQIASQKALPSRTESLVYQPILSTYYKDGLGIFTMMGVVCKQEERKDIKARFSNWKPANLKWEEPPIHINVPMLSTQERLHLQSMLPCAGKALLKALGYKIDGEKSLDQLKQYAEYYRQYPYFIRGIP